LKKGIARRNKIISFGDRRIRFKKNPPAAGSSRDEDSLPKTVARNCLKVDMGKKGNLDNFFDLLIEASYSLISDRLSESEQ
jgi:hypothetical protein